MKENKKPMLEKVGKVGSGANSSMIKSPTDLDVPIPYRKTGSAGSNKGSN